MSSCSGNCSSCSSSDCGDRKAESLLAKLNEQESRLDTLRQEVASTKALMDGVAAEETVNFQD